MSSSLVRKRSLLTFQETHFDLLLLTAQFFNLAGDWWVQTSSDSSLTLYVRRLSPPASCNLNPGLQGSELRRNLSTCEKEERESFAGSLLVHAWCLSTAWCFDEGLVLSERLTAGCFTC